MNGEGGYKTGYVIKVIAICDTKMEDTALKNSKKELKLPPFYFLFVTSRFNGQTSFSLSLLSVYNYRTANESSTNDCSTGSPY